jgi:hypothetical protein
MSDKGRAGSNEGTTPPFAALLAKSLAVCIIGGSFFAATIALGCSSLSDSMRGGAGPIDGMSALRLLVDGSTLVLLATVWGLLVTVPVGIPAGAIAAGLIWRVRGSSWEPSTRTSWTLLGSIGGLALAAVLGAPLSVLGIAEIDALLPMSAGTGAACGALLAWIVSPALIEQRRGRITTNCT